MSNITKSELDLVINRIGSVSMEDSFSMSTFRCTNRTQYEPLRISHNWTINDFRSLITFNDQQMCLKSSTFVSEVAPKINWRMFMFPRGGNLGGTRNGFIFMKVTSTSQYKKLTFKAKHKYIIKSHRFGTNDWNSDMFINTNSLHPDNPIIYCSIFCIPLSRIDNYLYGDGSLDICCEMEIIPDDKGIFCKEEVVKPPMDDVSHYINHASQLKKMYESSDEADCQIICNGTVLNVHKFMLIAYSPVFNAMFEHKETKESKENIIKIVDENLQTLETMIDYIYSGTIPELLNDDEIIDLLQLADKYDIQPLYHLCQDRLIFHLTEMNVCEMLQVSEAYKAQSLMDACIRLVARNLNHILESREWLEMEKTHSQLLLYVMKQITKRGS
uniref:Speckle-type POZ protein (inferred by orthology to a human protein) n=1 Tax=Strongyloides venezuelensis TaxID=75913 RepID=A0A0K0EZI5_STRVS